MDEDSIYRNLKKMNLEENRAIYREVSQVFHEVVLYNRAMLTELSSRIEQEKEDQQGKLYLYGTAARQEDAALADHLFYPVASESERRKDCLTTLFFEFTEEEMEQLYAGCHKALIETDKGSYEVPVTLIPAARYLEQEADLERQFYHNKILFGNSNLPYLHKFADVIAADFPETIQKENIQKENIRNVNLIGYEDIAKSGIIPLWNVKKAILPCAMFPVPAIDMAYYEHTITMPDPKDGYVVKEDPHIARVFFRDDTIVIWTELEWARKWEVYRVISPVHKMISIPHLKVTTNSRLLSHSDRQAESGVRLPRTKGEILRILNSYEVSKEISFSEDLRVTEEELMIANPITAPKGCPRTFASFGDSCKKPFIYIRCSPKEADFTIKEQISFLLGELACFFPEYNFVGELC